MADQTGGGSQRTSVSFVKRHVLRSSEGGKYEEVATSDAQLAGTEEVGGIDLVPEDHRRFVSQSHRGQRVFDRLFLLLPLRNSRRRTNALQYFFCNVWFIYTNWNNGRFCRKN